MGLAAAFADGLDHFGDWGLLATDAELVVTGWNRWLESRSGVAAEDAVGRALFDLFPEVVSRQLDRYYRQALAGQTIILSQLLHKYVIALPTPAGRANPGLMQQTARIVPLVDGSSVCGTLTVIEDVTERVTLESDLRARARQQGALADLARSALTGRDVAEVAREVVGHVRETLAVDFAEVLEFLPKERSWALLAGVGWKVSPPPVFEVLAAPRGRSVLEDNSPKAEGDVPSDPAFASDPHLRAHDVTSGMIVGVPKGGRGLFGLLGLYTRSPREFAPDEVRFISALADILGTAAERKRLEGEIRLRAEELANKDRRKDEFLAMLAHELRNPLAPVRNSLQIIRTKYTGDPLLEQMGDMMSRQVGHMARLVDDLLDASRISRGQVQLKKERVELATIVARGVEASRSLIDLRGHELSTSLPREPVYLDADPVRLTQVVGNLLNNAAKYTEQGGRIWLTAHREGDEAVIGVRDTGIGIPEEMLPRVFDLFTQVDPTLDRSQGGLGIGLTLVRTLVEMHGGTVSVTSDGPGAGSEFFVRLPALPGESDDTARQPAAEKAAVVPRRILIVDDNVDSADSLAMLLNLVGHEVWTAYDGASGILAAVEHRPQVILLDIGLPRMDGYEVARRLRQDPRTSGVTLVAMTGYGQPEDRRRTGEAGFDHHLVKPADLDELAELLAQPEKRSGD